ncbi:hypothetical protein [Brevibacillus borstelensis]|uniref:hypothetical protein n=1 Tax=Brevibacillus borstelensis TaxID=45462 RepID=UPI0004F23AD9|nr:hypothetical protein [Brevibacillus borstelensis]KKX54192.1 hypothetical protein X546_17740 [Brevibacillus borstelensis cifa_chp40]
MTARIFGVRMNKQGDDHDYMEFDLVEDVYYVSIYRPKRIGDGIFVFHTKYGAYHWINTLAGARKLWAKYGFAALDSVNVVNLNKIVGVNLEKMRVYFEDGSFTTVSYKKLGLVEHLLKWNRK